MKYVYSTCEYNGFTDLYTSGQKHIHLEFFRKKTTFFQDIKEVSFFNEWHLTNYPINSNFDMRKYRFLLWFLCFSVIVSLFLIKDKNFRKVILTNFSITFRFVSLSCSFVLHHELFGRLKDNYFATMNHLYAIVISFYLP